MLRIEDMDPRVTVRDQLGEETDQPVILINQFSVAPRDVEAMLLAWAEDARFFKAQPGFISAQLHQGTAGSTTFLNHAVWQSVAHFRAAFLQPEFQRRLEAYPDSVVGRPHLFRKVAVPGVCVA